MVLFKTDSNNNPRYKAAVEAKIKALSDEKVLECMASTKTSYSGFLSDIIRQNSGGKKPEQLIVKAALDAFTAINQWIPK